MIEATKADLGRRIIYRTPDHVMRGVLTGFYDHGVKVLFDGHREPMSVFSNLEWADGKDCVR